LIPSEKLHHASRILKPYGLARYDKQSGQAPLSPLTAGVDIKYGLSSSLLLNLTGNTDFADTEVDLQPFKITLFKIYLPEKRDFFLENAGVFNFPLGECWRACRGVTPLTGF